MDFILKKYMWVFYLLLVAMISYFAARITGTFVGEALAVDGAKNVRITKTNQVDSNHHNQVLSLSDYNIITERNLFDSRDIQVNASPEPGNDPLQFDPNAPAVRTSLAIKLISTFAIGDGTDPRSSATIANAQGGSKPEVYRVGDENAFSGSAKIVKILTNRVEFLNNGRMEYVEIETVTNTGGNVAGVDTSNLTGQNPVKGLFPRGGETKGASTKMTIDQRELDNALSKPDVLFTQINIGPYMDATGKPSGIRINRLSAQSLFSKLGLQAGDVLKRLNNDEMDMSKGMLIFSQLKDQKQFSLDIERRGQKMSFEYDVK